MSNLHKAFFAQVLANIIWGISTPINKWAFQSISPIDMIFLRLSITTIILFLLFRKHIAIKQKDFPAIFLIGFLGITLNIGPYYIGVAKTLSINGPLIASSAPILLLVGSALFLREKLSMKVIIGNIIGFLGLIYITLSPLLQTSPHESSSLTGNLLIVLSTVCVVISTLINKDIANKYSAITFLFWTFLVGSLTFLPFYLLHHTSASHIFTVPALGGIAYSVFLSSMTGYFLGYWSIKYMKASSVAIFGYIQPIAATLVAVPLLHEIPDSHFLLSMMLIFTGIFIAEEHLSRKSFYTPHMRHAHRHR
jgi:drug/metabolite transporter (DMT)-like permease